MKAPISLPALSRFSAAFLILLLLNPLNSWSQLPEAISIQPDSASGFDEITLTFDPDLACIPDGYHGFEGMENIIMESSAVLLFEEEGSWNYTIPPDEEGKDGTPPWQDLDENGLYNITFIPADFYGTGDELIKGITARFVRPGARGMDFGEEGCRDFYIPLHLDSTGLSLSLDMSYQVLLGNFDPFFDNVDVVGNFNNWGYPEGTDLDDPDNDSIYTVTIPDLAVGQSVEYKFRINRRDDNSENLEPDGFRSATLMEEGNGYTHWYNDLEPALDTLWVSVNMNYAEEQGIFDPANDVVDMEIFFRYWGIDTREIFLLSDPDSNGIYTTIIDSIYSGTEFSYGIRADGQGPGLDPREFRMTAGSDSLEMWWAWYNPHEVADLFFSQYLDGEGSSNAVEIVNPLPFTVDLSAYGIMYTVDGSAWSVPMQLAGELDSSQTWLMVHPGFDFSLIDSAGVVDSVWAEPCDFDGNDALAIVKIYDGGNKWRILDQIGRPGEDPGTGWDVAGIPGATNLHRLERKPSVEHGQINWTIAAGSSPYDSEWLVSGPQIPSDLGRDGSNINYDFLWTKLETGVGYILKAFASTDVGWDFAVGDQRTAIYQAAGTEEWLPISLDIPETRNLNGICFTDSLQGWICGSAGVILHTTNGIDWSSQESGTGQDLKSIYFTDSENGWAVGPYNILRTRDGGKTWERQDINPNASFNKIHFITREKGWLVCENSYVRYTEDGGETWEQCNGIPAASYRDLYFYDASYGWIVGEKAIYHTRNGGESWTRQVAPPWFYYGVHFSSPTDGIVVGDDRIFSTRDGGITWEAQHADIGGKLLTDVYFHSPNAGWILGFDGLMLEVRDQWNAQTSPTAHRLNSVWFTDESHGWIVGDEYTVLKTTDAGQTWDTLLIPLGENENDSYHDVFFVDPMHGWFGGAFGSVFRTVDGGKTWTDHSTAHQWTYGIYFSDRLRGWAVGNGGRVSRTTDGGITWDDTSIGTKSFTDVHFVDSLHGWVVGDEGRIIYSEDGGKTWVSQGGVVTSSTLHSVWFKDLLNGITVSEHNILRTADGGSTWEVGEIPGYHGQPDLHFIDSLRGWVSGNNGTVWYTADFGESWTAVYGQADHEFRSIFFLDERSGWAVGAGGLILHTTSGACRDPYVNLPGIARVCEGDEISLDGGNNYTWNWNTGSTDRTITVSSGEWYRVESENRCGRKASDSVFLEVRALPDIEIVPDGETSFCRNDQVMLNAIVLDSETDNEYSFSWKNDPENQGSSSQADTTAYFTVTVTDRYGCISEDSISIFEQHPFEDEEICLVTINENSARNLIIWNKTAGMGTDHYNIYREGTSIGQYNLIGTVPADQLSIFEDTTSQPESRSYLYKISLVDTCGNESGLSQYHKPLFLQYMGSIGGVNLEWSDYIVEGNPLDFTTYEIYRGDDSSDLQLIEHVPASLNRFTDRDAQATSRKYYYRVAGLKESPCFPSGSLKSEVDYSRSISNLKDNGIGTRIGPQFEGNDGRLQIYPNPATDKISISIRNPGHKTYRLFIKDLSGKTVKMEDDIRVAEFDLDIGNLGKGIFFIELIGEITYRGKVLIQ